MLTPAILGIGVFFVYPLVANVFYSFTRYDLRALLQWVGLRNYNYLFTQDPNVVKASLNTLWFVAILVPVRIVSALVVAGLIVRVKHAAGFGRMLFYLLGAVPLVASVVAFASSSTRGPGP